MTWEYYTGVRTELTMAEDKGAKTENGGDDGDVPMEDAGAETGGGSRPGLGADDSILNSVEQPQAALAFEMTQGSDEPIPSSSPTTSTKMAKPATKKRGTAAAKRTPKKARGSKSKAAKKGQNANDAHNAANEESSDDEIDNGPYCICRGPDDHRWMISCDVCEDWFHGECIKIAKDLGEKLIERFVCPNCTDGKLNYTKYKKTCSLQGCTNPARLYGKKDKSVFCCNDHCDSWWAAMISTLPTKESSEKAIELLTQEDFMGLLASTASQGGWKLGDKPFGNIQGFWANGLPTRPGVLSDEDEAFLQKSAAERLALGNVIVQYKKMMQLIDWANSRRQTAIELGKFTKDSCGYDDRLDTVSVRFQFAAFLESPEGQATFAAGKLDTPIEPGECDPATRGMCEKKRCKPHNGWYKLLVAAVRNDIKETASSAASKLEREEVLRQEAETRFKRCQLENNCVVDVE